MTTPDEKLPIYRPVFDELTDLTFVSLVDDPAIGVKGIALSKQKDPVKIELKFDDYKQVIAGPVLIPDILIYRHDPILGEFNLQFTKEDIQGLFDIYNQKVSSDKINVDHSFISKSGYPQGNWIVEFKEDKSVGYGYDLPIGTWFMETKIKDKAEFIKLKESGMNSFSIEAVFNLMKVALKNNNIKMENNEIKTEEVIDTVLEVTPEVEEVKDEVKKLEITPEDIAMIWEAIKPMVAEMIGAETEEEAPVEDEAMKALESKLSKQISDLEATIKNTPAVESITLSKVTDPRASEFQTRLEAIRKVAKL